MSYPTWLQTERLVERYFRLLGFDVKHVSIFGRQIDILANRIDPFTSERQVYVIEVTTEKVGVEKGSRDSQKLLLAREEHKNARLMLVSMAGFTDDQAATLERLGIAARRFSELESTLLPLHRYAVAAQQDLLRSSAPDIGYQPTFYIEPQIDVQSSEPNVIPASRWIETILTDSQPGICAVLGSLGSGKTSLLRRLLELGISRFLDAPDTLPLPLYIPLGRYKQHAGDLDQMMMAELKRSGVESYPTSMVNFLLETRRIIILLDGLDEIHPIQNTDDILETVTNIVDGIGKSASGVISCRRQFFESSTEEQAYFGSYTAGKLKDLNAGIQKILRGQTSSYIANILPFDIERVKRYLFIRCNLSSEESDQILSQYYGFPDMATTPVLLAMIATTVTEGGLGIQSEFYFPHVALYEAYTTRWIERDVGRARLSASQRNHFSERLADHMLWNARESALWSEISEALGADPEWGNNPLTREEAELDIRNSGFLLRDMDDRWRFVHRSILEYFAARAELGRLIEGERPRYIPTDGYRLFLSELIARHWVQTGVSPFPTKAWHNSRGSEVRANQWSLLANASSVIPNEARVTLANVGSIHAESDADWLNTNFKRLELSISSGRVLFQNCSFSDCAISVPIGHRVLLDFRDCTFESTSIKFAQFPVWTTAFDASNPQAVDLPVAVFDFSAFVDAGAKVHVAEHEWILRAPQLMIFIECAKRLKGKAFKHNFLKGAYASELEHLLPSLVQRQLIAEDASRQTHQLSWTASGRALVTRLRTTPETAQAEVADLFRNQGS